MDLSEARQIWRVFPRNERVHSLLELSLRRLERTVLQVLITRYLLYPVHFITVYQEEGHVTIRSRNASGLFKVEEQEVGGR